MTDEATMKLELDLRVDSGALELDLNQHGSVRNTHRNAIQLLSVHPLWRGAIAYDVRAEAPLFKRKPPAYAGRVGTFPRAITDVDQTAIIAWCSHQTGGTDFTDSKVRRAIDLVARVNEFDPVVEYLQGLKWDGRSRIDDWVTRYLGVAPTIFASSVGAKFLISAVARALRPGCKVDHVLVLEGRQGLGKTSALSVLGGDFYRGDLPPLDGKEVKEALRGAWIAELSEFASMNKSELTAAKMFLTLAEDTYRVPYGTRSETRKRRLVFAASTNEREYLRDQTGNRRFWPLWCTAIDTAALAADRDQLWAEAVVRFNRGDPWHLCSQNEIEAAVLEQEKRREIDPWEERVTRFAYTHQDFTPEDVLKDLGVETSRQSIREKTRVSAILRKFGYELGQVRFGKLRVRVYRPSVVSENAGIVSHVSRVDLASSTPEPRVDLDSGGTRDTRDGTDDGEGAG